MLTAEQRSEIPRHEDITPSQYEENRQQKIAELKILFAEESPEKTERGRIDRIAPRVIDDFLAGYHEGLIRQKFFVDRVQLKAIVNAGTTVEQRREVKAYIHRMKVKEWMRVDLLRHPRIVGEVAIFASVTAAARAMGIPYNTARNYHRRGIPPEKWAEERAKPYPPCRAAIATSGFASIRDAAAAAGISLSAARRYTRDGVAFSEWRELATRNRINWNGRK